MYNFFLLAKILTLKCMVLVHTYKQVPGAICVIWLLNFMIPSHQNSKPKFQCICILICKKKNVYVLSSFDCTVMSLHHLIRRFQHSFEVGPISHRRDAKFPRASSVLEWHHANISQLLRNDDAYRLKAVDISAEILRSRNQLLQKCCFFFFFLRFSALVVIYGLLLKSVSS